MFVHVCVYNDGVYVIIILKLTMIITYAKILKISRDYKSIRHLIELREAIELSESNGLFNLVAVRENHMIDF